MAVSDFSQAGPSFGYLPEAVDFASFLERGRFARALAVEAPVKATLGRIKKCRILWGPEVDLPAGEAEGESATPLREKKVATGRRTAARKVSFKSKETVEPVKRSQ